jgi:iron-sulfur cluster assembly protein
MKDQNNGGSMIHLSDSARKELEAYFEGKERGGIRIYLAPGG